MLRVFATITFVTVSASGALAQWVTQTQGGEFDENPMHIALTAKGRYGFGFRCNSNELKVILVTPEDVDDDDTISVMNAASPKLRIKVDGGDIITLDAELDNPNNKLGVISDVDLGVVKSVAGAKSKVSAVLTVLGQNFHETSFNVRGSSTALNKLIKDCKLND